MVVSGMVQGVGFRPFVFRLASRIGLAGWVKNVFGHVVIHVEGRTENIRKFKDRLINESPPNALPLLSDEKQVSVSCTTGFHILASDPESIGEVSVPLDNYLCSACELELSDPGDRRFQYPFIACSDCGPRYSIVTRLPYDRLNTTMATFNLCEVCEEEYTSPFNRRLHAQPLACPSCGPRIELADGQGIPIDTKDHSVIESVVALLKKGEIIALKSVGGYHLICDASNDSAVARLRDKKSRPDRPFAVMFPSYETDQHEALMDRCVMLSELERHALMSDSRPIVLVKRRTSQHISKYVAKDFKETRNHVAVQRDSSSHFTKIWKAPLWPPPAIQVASLLYPLVGTQPYACIQSWTNLFIIIDKSPGQLTTASLPKLQIAYPRFD